MQTLTVQLAACHYPIYIGDQLLQRVDLLQQHIKDRQVLIVSNSIVASYYLPALQRAFDHYQCDTVLLPDGEQFKTLETLQHIFDALLSYHHRRQTTLVALGGGVIGDMTGFAAACYQRGVDFIQIPTTLLAQVDASVGGKTAVNHRLGKNMIGAFHQPRAVLIDIATLQTLPQREFCAGLAEIIKAALICDEHFFIWLESHMTALREKRSEELTEAITRACAIKAAIVASDEKEQNGKRALLNLGHTFGHAIETCLGYGTWLHGEAVALGLILAAKLSSKLGWIAAADVLRIQQLIERAQLPTTIPKNLTADQLLEAMQRDKKVVGEQLAFVLLNKIGEAVFVTTMTPQQVRDVFYE